MSAAEYRKKIADLNVHAMGESTEWDAHGREVFALVHQMADEIERLQAVGKKALHEMCHTTAARNSFTDVVDELDAILNPS